MSVQEMAPYDEYVVVLGNVRAEIARRRLSQSDIAREMGQNQQWLSRRLIGYVPLSVPELMTLAGIIGVDIADLLPVRRQGLEPRTRCLSARARHLRLVLGGDNAESEDSIRIA